MATSNHKERIAEIEKKLQLARKEAGLNIIANIAMKTGDYAAINNVDLRAELIVNVIDAMMKKEPT